MFIIISLMVQVTIFKEIVLLRKALIGTNSAYHGGLILDIVFINEVSYIILNDTGRLVLSL